MNNTRNHKLEHDKLATRLSLIIYKLNQGERLTIESLANEFGVSKRTIERDIARFSYFDIKKEGKEFFLDELAVGKLNFDDIKNFAIFSGIKSLFPSLTNQFLKDILNEKINRAYIVQNCHVYLNGSWDCFTFSNKPSIQARLF